MFARVCECVADFTIIVHKVPFFTETEERRLHWNGTTEFSFLLLLLFADAHTHTHAEASDENDILLHSTETNLNLE